VQNGKWGYAPHLRLYRALEAKNKKMMNTEIKPCPSCFARGIIDCKGCGGSGTPINHTPTPVMNQL